ncbi:MAG: hypothetical protein J6M60_02525 [Clostridia bacterium]|nr:hypothetical protein [Clostridia bacterium]
MKNNKKGITLVALVITIIILLILAGVTITLVLGEDGLISRAKEAGYKSNFSEIQEKTMLYWTNSEQDDIINMQNRTVLEKLPILGEANKSSFKSTLIAEIKAVREDSNLDVNSLELYEIDKTKINSNVSHKYIIDLADLQIYDVDGEEFRGKWHHTLRGLGVEGSGENTQTVIGKPAQTSEESFWNGNIGWLKPDLTGFDLHHTFLVYYNSDFSKSHEVPIENYINDGRQSKITYEGEEYILDDYVDKRWANVKTNSNGIEAWWVWIPRYAYKINGTSSNPPMDIIFLDTQNNRLLKDDAQITDEEFEEYTIQPAFTETWTVGEGEEAETKTKTLQGIWMSKYEPSNLTNETRVATSGKCYPPDISGFDKNNTWIEYVDIENNTFTEGPKLADANMDNENNNTNWYDYSNKVWANVKTKANDIECWWVWIPRYAYSISQGAKEVDIIFVDENDKPYDKESYGDRLPSGMIVHPAFNETVDGTIVKKLKGIWMSKYEPSNVTNETRNASSGECYAPDIEGFDENNSWMVYYNEDFSKSREVLLKDYKAGGMQRQITYENETYTLYSYNNKIWANIKTMANGIEAWWVWIPRYAYIVNQGGQDTGVIFVNLENKPYDSNMGNELKPGMIVHPAFTEIWTEEENGEEVTKTKELKGIWMSKYEPSWINN